METMSDAAEKSRLAEITFDKHLRFRLDEAIQEIRARPGSAERTLAFRALQTARHWLGEDLAILGAQHPYPNGNNPANTIVDPPADVNRLNVRQHGGCTFVVNPDDLREHLKLRGVDDKGV